MKNKLLLSLLAAGTMLSAANAQILGPVTTPFGVSTTFYTPVEAFTYHWAFDPMAIAPVIPPITPLIGLGSVGSPGPLNVPAFGCFVQGAPGGQPNGGTTLGNYYYFVTEYNTGNLWRYDYGTTFPPTGLIAPPTLVGNYAASGNNLECIDLMEDGADHWYGLMVNSNNLIELYFGNGLNNLPTATNIIPFGFPILAWPHQVTIKQFDAASGGGWHAFVANRNGTLVRFDFGPTIASLMNPAPVTTVIPNVGGVLNPCNFTLYHQPYGPVGWYAIVTSLITGNLTVYNFGPSLMNPAPAGALIPGTAGFTVLPREVSILPGCQGQLQALVFNETGNVIQLNFPGGDITLAPGIANLGPSGSAFLGSCAPAAYTTNPGPLAQAKYGYILPNFSTGNISLFDPFVPLPAPPQQAYVDYMQLHQDVTFTAPGFHPITLFCDMGRPSGPSTFCSNVNVVPPPPPCYDDLLSNLTVVQDPNYPCTFTACVNVTSPYAITDYTWDVEPGSNIVVNHTGLPTDCYTFSIAFPVVYTVTVTAHILDKDKHCCEAVFTQTVTCGDPLSTPAKPGRGTTSIGNGSNSVSTAAINGYQLFPNPTTGAITVTSADDAITSVTVLDIYGKKIKEFTYDNNSKSTEVPLTGLPNGSYLIRVNNKITQLVVKKE
jgi:Secretion system C-terminal sorting domain